jgi:membrane associated rhomboid family serine protease
LIPLKDNIPTDRFPILTVLLIVINVGVFLWQTQYPTDRQLDRVGLTAIDQSAIKYGAIPHRLTHPAESGCLLAAVPQPDRLLAPEVVCEGTPGLRQAEAFAAEAAAQGVSDRLAPLEEPRPLDQAPWWVTIFASMFMHGGLLHIAFNMLFLWIFGANIEDSMGRLRFLLFYFLAGGAAVYAQALVDTSATVPTIGASGAVAGVLGGYALLFPRARVLSLVLIVYFVTLIEVPAWILLGIWFILQFVPAIGQTAIPDLAGDPGVAYLAHVGGFVFGLAAIKLFAKRHRPADVEPPYPVY